MGRWNGAEPDMERDDWVLARRIAAAVLRGTRTVSVESLHVACVPAVRSTLSSTIIRSKWAASTELTCAGAVDGRPDSLSGERGGSA